jgi:hypothetical protein
MKNPTYFWLGSLIAAISGFNTYTAVSRHHDFLGPALVVILGLYLVKQGWSGKTEAK